MKRLSIICITFLAVVLAGCDKNENEITPISIAQGYEARFGGGTSEIQSFVIKTHAEWESLIKGVNQEHFTETNIDFDKYQILAISKICPSLYWSISIKHITEYSDKIVATVYINAPKVPTGSAITYPYHIVKIPATIKEVEFKYIYQ